MGLAVSIDDIEHPRPGVVRYHGVRLRDPETGEVVTMIHRIDACCQEVKESSRPALVLIADSAHISPERFDSLPRLLHRVMSRRMTRDNIDLRLIVGKIKLQEGEDSAGEHITTLSAVQGSLQTVRDGAQAEFQFRLDSSKNSADPTNAVRVRVRRDRRTTPPSLCFEIDSRAASMPSGMLSLLMPECESLGPQSRFRGYLFAEQTSEGWKGCVKDSCLDDIDLARLLKQRFPKTITGRASVIIQHASFADGRLIEVVGSVAAWQGTVNREFFDTASMQFCISPRDLKLDTRQELPYFKLAFDFSLNHHGLTIHGTIPNDIRPVTPITMIDAEGPLLGEPKVQPQPIPAWLGVLVAPTSPHIPVTEQTQWLASLLPLPEESKSPKR
ncbi:MAG: hypothetical protein JXM70_07635 [Pirellulales bacterium]|nr:hypothetical protein [Pirellulales bacterium]